MKIKVFNIAYDVGVEDVMSEIDEDDYALRSDYLLACEEKVDEIIDGLPSEVELDVADDADDEAISDALSDKTGWLTQGFCYNIVEYDEKSKEALEALYRGHKAHCCKCGCELEDNIGNGVGAVFVLDKGGRFYCCNCDWCFTEGDERIFDIDEE